MIERSSEICYFSEGSAPDSLLHLRNFKPIICQTPAQIKSSMRLRYDVYCLRKGWEAAQAFPDRLESDEFDEHSVHILLIERQTGLAVGCTRVVFADPSVPDARLPSFALAPDFREATGRSLPLASTVELSRLTVLRGGEAPADSGTRDSPGRVSLALGLLKGVGQAMAAAQATHGCFLGSRSLQRLMEGFGFRFYDFGLTLQHRGTRSFLWRDWAALMTDIHDRRPDVWRYLTDDGAIWPVDRAAIQREREALSELEAAPSLWRLPGGHQRRPQANGAYSHV
jgi:N-acyl amino acid synthase of PEP-CTERM/exosortase system